MTTKQIPEERIAKLRERSKIGREAEDAARSQVAAEHRAFVNNLLRILANNGRGIEAYIAKHGPMTRGEVVEQALSKLLSEV